MDAHVGNRLRRRREELGLSQTGLAKAAGVPVNRVQRYEIGATRISAGRLYELGEILDVPVAYFFDEAQPELSGPIAQEASLRRRRVGARTSTASVRTAGARRRRRRHFRRGRISTAVAVSLALGFVTLAVIGFLAIGPWDYEPEADIQPIFEQ